NVGNNIIDGKVEFEFNVETDTRTQTTFDDENIETQDEGNMPTSPQSQPQTEYLLARDHERRQEIPSPECDKWVVAMDDEVKDGIPEVESKLYKARFDQRGGIDFNEVSPPKSHALT
ncbi:hypothetical protein Tco_0165186, partial [Tanacetum coccineum]